ncbi:hypothetical protein QOT17_016283 [Balamuthia mandrillaris]
MLCPQHIPQRTPTNKKELEALLASFRQQQITLKEYFAQVKELACFGKYLLKLLSQYQGVPGFTEKSSALHSSRKELFVSNDEKTLMILNTTLMTSRTTLMTLTTLRTTLRTTMMTSFPALHSLQTPIIFFSGRVGFFNFR